ncbi:MAG: hypothetical protein OXH76_07870 [Boseongicola sp.]|nr:hypothetical protein [Boseongicola sp.]
MAAFSGPMVPVIPAHRFATGLPCRAGSLAGNAMLASLRVPADTGCGSRPFGRASLAREGPRAGASPRNQGVAAPPDREVEESGGGGMAARSGDGRLPVPATTDMETDS